MQLQKGNVFNKPISKIDTRFGNHDYHTQKKTAQKKLPYNKLCNNKQGFTSMDTTWEELHQLNDHNCDVLAGSSFVDKIKPIYLSIQTLVMAALSKG
jgi:hypothetical protein